VLSAGLGIGLRAQIDEATQTINGQLFCALRGIGKFVGEKGGIFKTTIPILRRFFFRLVLAIIIYPCSLKFSAAEPINYFVRPDGLELQSVNFEPGLEYGKGIFPGISLVQQGGNVWEQGISKSFFRGPLDGFGFSVVGQGMCKPLAEPLDKDAADENGKQTNDPSFGVGEIGKPEEHWLFWLVICWYFYYALPIFAMPNVLVSGGPLRTENVARRFRPVRST
jgi:hypothetical protein